MTDRVILPEPRPRELAAVVRGLQDGACASTHLDVCVAEAMGWEVTRASYGTLLRINPHGGRPHKLPTPSRLVDHAAALRPWGWSWHAGWKWDPAQQAGTGVGWVQGHPPTEPGRLPEFYEAKARTPALALLRAALTAHLLATQAAITADAAPRCACGWSGPDAARTAAGGCPDCNRRLAPLDKLEAPACNAK